MASFSVYWPADVVDRLPVDAPGPRLKVFYGGPHQSQPSFRRARVQEGDRLYPVTVRQRILYVLGSVRVREILEVDELDEERGGWPARFPEWTFLNRRGERPLRRVDPDGRILSADGLQGIYELHPDTADGLHAVVGRGLVLV